MSKPHLVIIGAGGHARACLDVVQQIDTYKILGLIGLPEETDADHLGHRVIGSDRDLPGLVGKCPYAFVAVGHITSPALRIRLYERLGELGFRLPDIVAPTAYVSRHAVIGPGTIVMHGAVVNAGARVGQNCIVNTRAVIEHDAAVADHCHISTGAILNGGVQVGRGSFVGSGSVVREGVVIGADCLIGMGLAVRHHQEQGTRFTGGRIS